VKPTVFIQANARQRIGAKISAYSDKRNSRSPGSFNVTIMMAEDFPRLTQSGRSILRAGNIRGWDPGDLQTFTPLRFAPPALMGFKGRALVSDPDCFAIGDVVELLERDLAGKSLLAKPQPGHNGNPDYIASSVMVLDCAKLRHWDFDPLLDRLFAHDIDYVDWIELKYEDRSKIGFLEPEWNSFDTLTRTTKLLHTTNRRTQPWKTGLPVDYTLRKRGWWDGARRIWHWTYQAHPDSNQEALVYALLSEMLDSGIVTEPELVREMGDNHIRHDSLELIDRYRGWLPPIDLPVSRNRQPRFNSSNTAPTAVLTGF
jgi:hypothetical protein